MPTKRVATKRGTRVTKKTDASTSPGERLYLALGANDLDEIRCALEGGASPNARPPAAISGAARKVKAALGLDVKSVKTNLFAVRSGAALELLLGAGANVSLYGRGLLSDVIANKRELDPAERDAIVLSLVGHDAAFAADALDAAADCDNAGLIAALVLSNPGLLSPGCEILHEAAERGKLESVRALLKAGAKVDALDRDGLTPLWRVVWPKDQSVWRKKVMEDRKTIVRELVAAGANMRHESPRGEVLNEDTDCHPIEQFLASVGAMVQAKQLDESVVPAQAASEVSDQPLGSACERCGRPEHAGGCRF